MYTPQQQPILSGGADYKGDWDNYHVDNTDWNQAMQNLRDKKKETQEDTDSYYDKLRQDQESLNESLKNLEGEDFNNMQRSIVEKRDALKELYKKYGKGDGKKNWNSPEFQSQRLAIFDELGGMRNGIESSLTDLQKAKEMIERVPHIHKGEAYKRIEEARNLPPEKRRSVVRDIMEDERLFNSFDWLDGILDQSAITEDVEETEWLNGSARKITKQNSTFDVYEKDENGKLVVKDEFVNQLFASDPRFERKMQSMIPPEDLAKLDIYGHQNLIKEQTRREAKEYIDAVVKTKQKSKVLEKSAWVAPKTEKEKTADKPSAREEERSEQISDVKKLQKRLIAGDATAIREFIGRDLRNPDGSPADQPLVTKEGNKVRIKGKYFLTEAISGLKEEVVIDELIDPNAFSDVSKIYMALKYPNNKDKVRIFTNEDDPDYGAEEQPKGKSITRAYFNEQAKKENYNADEKAEWEQMLKDQGYTITE